MILERHIAANGVETIAERGEEHMDDHFSPSTVRFPEQHGVRISLWSFYLSDSVISRDSWWANHFDTLFIRGFQELCSIIEATVLFENVYTDLSWDLTPLDYSAVAKELHAGGVLKPDDLTMTAYDGKERSAVVDALSELQKCLLTSEELERLTGKDQSITEAIQLDMVTDVSAIFSGLTYKPLVFRQMLVPSLTTPPNVERELIRLYSRAVRQLRDDQSRAVMHGFPCRIFIPPVAAMVISDAKRPNNIPAVLLEYRRRFAPLRDRIRALQHAISADNATLNDVDYVSQSLKQMAARLTPSDQRPEVARVAFLRNLGSFLISSLLKMGLDYGGLFKLISTDTAQWISDRYDARGAIVLTDVIQKYKSIKHYGTLVERVFGHTLEPSEIRAMEHSMRLRPGGVNVDLEVITDGWAFLQMR
jgi:hypothetical protein